MATLCFRQKLQNEQSVVCFDHVILNVPSETIQRIQNLKEEDRQWFELVITCMTSQNQVTIWNAEMQKEFDAEFPV